MSEQVDGSTTKGLAPDVKRALLPALIGFVALVLIAVFNVLFRDEPNDSTPAVLGVAVAVLLVVAMGTMVAAGFRAAKGLRTISLESGPGRFAVGMAVVLAVMLAVMTITLGLLATTDTWEQDSEPFIGIWVVLALVASLIGAFAPEPGRRGLLVFPFLIGIAALMLFISEALGIT